ncbi:MAG: histidinol-phosphatase [Verrucomicrobiae bacterium]|nr:histidinol-phosphatase [Verrucomicrobiae bacterium]
MPIVGDYHMHTPRCKHATGPIAAYAEAALKLGLSEIGFSDHSPLPDGRGANVRMAPQELPAYVEEVLALREQYRSRLTIRLGLELDFVIGLESFNEKLVTAYPWDYVLGSVHYLDPDCRLSSWPANYRGNHDELFERYFALVRQMARSGLVDVVAHLDVVKRCGTPPGPQHRKLIETTLDEIAHAGVALEINTSGYRHPELRTPEPYPSFNIIAAALQRDIPLQVNSDAHDPSHVGMQFQMVTEQLRRTGCRSLVRFERRERLTYPI